MVLNSFFNRCEGCGDTSIDGDEECEPVWRFSYDEGCDETCHCKLGFRKPEGHDLT